MAETDDDERLRRILLTILLAVIAVPVVAFAALCIWVGATQGHPPRMFADVPQDFRDEGPWTARMARLFPAGTPEAVLIDRLEDDGFDVNPVSRSAIYRWGNGIPCNHTVAADWSADGGRVTAVGARYGNACW